MREKFGLYTRGKTGEMSGMTTEKVMAVVIGSGEREWREAPAPRKGAFFVRVRGGANSGTLWDEWDRWLPEVFGADYEWAPVRA